MNTKPQSLIEIGEGLRRIRMMAGLTPDQGDFVGGIWQSSFEWVQKECAIIKIEDKIDIKVIKKIKDNLFQTFYYLDHQQSQTLTITRFAPVVRLWWF